MKDRRSIRLGLTIVEVLVVAFVVIVIAALFFPNVRVSREAARRMQCTNNFRQIALAIHNYESAFKRLPAAMGGTGVGDTKLAGNANRLSGLVALLPYLEQAKLWDTISAPAEFEGVTYPVMGPAPWVMEYEPWSTNIPVFRCPSMVGDQPNVARTNYAFCIGDMARDIHKPAILRGAFACGLVSRLEDIQDGTSQTIAMAEIGNFAGTALVGQIAMDRPLGVLNNPSSCQEVRDPRYQERYAKQIRLSQLGRGGRWVDGAAGFSLVATILPPNSPSCAVSDADAVDGIYSAGSQHESKGVMVAMADGSVHFISEDIDTGDLTCPTPTIEQMAAAQLHSSYGVWGALGTSAASDRIDDEKVGW